MAGCTPIPRVTTPLGIQTAFLYPPFAETATHSNRGPRQSGQPVSEDIDDAGPRTPQPVD